MSCRRRFPAVVMEAEMTTEMHDPIARLLKERLLQSFADEPYLTPLDAAALVAAKVRELMADLDVISVEADPEDATKIIVTRRLLLPPQLEHVELPPDLAD